MPRKSAVARTLLLSVAAVLLAGAHAVGAGPGARGDTVAVDALAGAMERQRTLVRAWPAGERVAGYKIAFNTPELQRRFGLDRPAVAALPASAERCAAPRTPCVVAREREGRPVVEAEIALRLRSAITRPLAGESELLEHVDAALPAIELPDLAVDGVAAPTGIDYVATGIGVRGYILGDARDARLLLREAPQISLARGDERLAAGSGAAALAAAVVLVNEALAAGYELRAGQILLTGAVGGMVPAQPGDYAARYGALGELRFTLR
jgi:2-keto-4-pentenoate hydratase